MADKLRHPGATVFVIAFEVIAEEKGKVPAIGVEDLEDPYIRLINGDVVPLFERESIKLVGGVENTVLQHVIEFKIRLYLSLVEIVSSFANLLGVIVPVPRLELEASFL